MAKRCLQLRFLKQFSSWNKLSHWKSQHLLEWCRWRVLLFMTGTKLYCTGMESFSEETTNYWFASVGYRYQPAHQRGLTYRAFVSPLFQKGFPVKLWGGVSIGYRF
jgi:hypothetical protein